MFSFDGKRSAVRENDNGLKRKNFTPSVKHAEGVLWFSSLYNVVDKLHFIDVIIEPRDNVCIPTKICILHQADWSSQIYISTGKRPQTYLQNRKNYFLDKNINFLNYPAQLADMNPIESLWRNIKVDENNLSVGEWSNCVKYKFL